MPRNIVKKIFWSSTLSLIVFGVLGIGSLATSLIAYAMLMVILIVAWSLSTGYGAIKNKLAESKLKDGLKRYDYNKIDYKLFNKKIGFFRIIFKAFAHTWRMVRSNDDVEHVTRFDNELLIQYPVNPNVSEGDFYHVRALSVDRLIKQDNKTVILQGYCHEMKRIYNFELDKIQQVFDFPSGLPFELSKIDSK